jgi:ATP-dependent helicase/nuclease subunit B
MLNHTIDTIFKAIDEQTTIITPNRRLSATLHKLFQQYQLEHKQTSWPTPDILPINSWIERSWEQLNHQTFTAGPFILNTLQERYLWEKVVMAENTKDYFLQISETAELARTGWGLLKQWRVDINHPVFQCAEDYIAFNTWANTFHAECSNKNYLDQASLVDDLIIKIINDEVVPSKKIILYGFTELSPQYRHLLTCCENAGSTITTSTLSHQRNDVHYISLIDNETEILTMARWAKTIHQQQPNARIGCVIPGLDKMRDRVWQLFAEVLTDDSAFNISAGKSLLSYPIINTAIQALLLHKNKISIDEANVILCSPFLGHAESERIKRSLFDAQLRQRNAASINLRSISTALSAKCPQLAKRLTEFFTILDNHQDNYAPSKWVTIFTELLSAIGWPGERSLCSEEYQMVESWLTLLNDFAKLDQVTTAMSLKNALHTLQKAAAKTVFQAKTPEAPIQVLGMLEAAALPFDYLWVAGLDDVSWPPQPKPNPFIPKKLQRELQMPHATAERELVYCEQMTEQFKQSAQHVIFSHAEKNAELTLQPSPLIRDLPTITIDDLHLDHYITPSERLFASKQIELLTDQTGPTFIATEKIRGGVATIKQQAICPFKAFAEWRLHARELESPLPGLRPKERGSLLHKVLEVVWNALGNQQSLLALSNTELSTLISNSIDLAFDAVPQVETNNSQYMQLEKQRMYQLTYDWLQLEKTRAPFSVITNEKGAEITLNQLTLSVRIDRIDELADGTKLIIDYKTGKNNHIHAWFSDRPEEPQMPLYALLDPTQTAGIAFAQLYPGDNCFKGISDLDLDIHGIKAVADVKSTPAATWAEQLTEWQTTLTQLSDHFYHGVALVDPKDGEQTCTWCALKPLCRINEEVALNA